MDRGATLGTTRSKAFKVTFSFVSGGALTDDSCGNSGIRSGGGGGEGERAVA